MAFSTQGTTLTGKLVRTATVTATASPAKFIRAVGSFVTDGFRQGMTFTTTATGNTGVTFTITNVTALEITVTPAPTVLTPEASATFTLLAPIGEMTDFSGLGGSASEIDVTHLGSSAREFVMGLKDSGSLTVELQFEPGDVGQIFLRERQDVLSVPTAFVLSLSSPTPTLVEFDAFVQGFSISGAVDEKVTASVTLRITGVVSFGDMA
jgi:hypothetical protein